MRLAPGPAPLAVGEDKAGPVLVADRPGEGAADGPGGALVPQAASAASTKMIMVPEMTPRTGLITTSRPDAAPTSERQLRAPGRWLGAIFPASLAPQSRARAVSPGSSRSCFVTRRVSSPPMGLAGLPGTPDSRQRPPAPRLGPCY
jgi:hypothetical protein